MYNGYMKDQRVSGYDIRGNRESDLTIEEAWNFGKALADQLVEAGKIVVVSIATQKNLAKAFIEGVRLQGRDVIEASANDKEVIKNHISSMGLAGGAFIAFDDMATASIIELYDHNGQLIDSERGLKQIGESAESGNFVPAVTKGDLSALA
jgi:phosphomannomutase